MLRIAAGCIALASLTLLTRSPAEFQTSVIDVGVVVENLERSVEFYTKSLGMAEVPGFSVPADFCSRAGLTDSHALTVRVLVAGEAEGATKLKLMELPAAKPKKADHAFVHSQLGMSYLTLHVSDLSAILKRMKQQGHAVLAEGPVPLNPAEPQGTNLALVRDPDGNLVELLGPMDVR